MAIYKNLGRDLKSFLLPAVPLAEGYAENKPLSEN
jgi:hypothetical protein